MRWGLIAVLSVSALGLWAQTGTQLSGVYLTQALQAYQEGDGVKALGLLDSALEFDPDSGDALGLKGLILSGLPPYDRSLHFLEKALERGNFFHLKRNQVTEALGTTYLRLRNYNGIIRLLGTQEPKTAEEFRLVHLAYDLSGRSSEALAVLRVGKMLHPFWPGWLELLLRYPGAEPQLIPRLRKYRKDSGGFSPAQLDRITRRLPTDREFSRKLISELLAQGYQSAGLELSAVELGIPLPPSYPGASIQDMARDYLKMAILTLPSEGPDRDRLLSAAAGYSGRAEWDEDRDGWAEMTLEFLQGGAEKWSLDQNQNGEPEMEVFFSGRRVHRVREKAGEISYEAEFEEYPFLKSLVLEQPEGKRTFHFPDFQVSWKLWEAPEGLAGLNEPLYWKWNSDSGSLESLLQQAAQVDRFTPEGRLESRSRLSEGQEFYREVDADGNGRRDMIIQYALGAPYRIWKDMDGDGRPDLLEKITKGGKVIWSDTDGNQVYDFGITSEGWKVWDYNRDREPDFRLLRLPGRDELKVVSFRGRTETIPTFPDWESPPWP